MGNRQGMAENLAGLTVFAIEDDDLTRATSLTQEMLEIAGDMNSLRHMAMAERTFAHIAERKGNLRESRRRYERALSLVSDRQMARGAELGLSQVASSEGNYREARLHLQRCFQYGLNVQRLTERFYYRHQTAVVVAHEGRTEQAVAILALALALEESPERAQQLRDRPEVADLLTELQAALTPEEFAAAWSRGQTLSWEKTMEELLAEWEAQPDK
jgi:tetratricopeptide (TPR) repeat protein